MSDEISGLHATLVRTALTMLEEGQPNISLRGVARAAGVSAMAPYRHFADKAALLGAVASQGFEALRTDLEAADRDAAPVEALVAQGLAYIAFASRHPALFRLMFADQTRAVIPGSCDTDAYAVLARRVETVVAANSSVAALACWSIVHGLATLALDGRVPPDLVLQRNVLDLFVSGLWGRDRAGSPTLSNCAPSLLAQSAGSVVPEG